MAGPRIYLVHAAGVSIDPVQASFRALWPEARVANILEDSLMTDLAADGRLTDTMVDRFRRLGQYCVVAGADAILFACSAFGPAIEVVRREQQIPVLKPNEAMYDELVAAGGRAALLATFQPSIPSMVAEIEACARAKGVPIGIETRLVAGALEALQRGDAAGHNRLIAEEAARVEGCDTIAFAQFSMAPAAGEARGRTKTPILTTPDSAVNRLKGLVRQ